jgi:predicted Na+-dependent transporter
MLRSAFTLTLAVVLLSFGIVQMIRPFSGAPIKPLLLIIAALLLFLRYGLVVQRQKRLELMKAVRKRPLGLSDDDAD